MTKPWEQTRIFKNLEEVLKFLKEDHTKKDAAAINKLVGFLTNLNIAGVKPIGAISELFKNARVGMDAIYSDAKVNPNNEEYLKKLEKSFLARINQELREVRAGLMAPIFGVGNMLTLGGLTGFAKGYRSVFAARKLEHGLRGTRARVKHLHGNEGVDIYDKNFLFRFGSDLRVLLDTFTSIPLASIFGFAGVVSGVGGTLEAVMKKLGVPTISENLATWGEKNGDKAGMGWVSNVVGWLGKKIGSAADTLADAQSALPPGKKAA
jgi:hypothetical protein